MNIENRKKRFKTIKANYETSYGEINNKKVSALLSNENAYKVRFCHIGKCFKYCPEDGVKEKRFRGLRDLLSKTFWSDYVYSRDKYSESTGVSSNLEGIERGILVHKQLRDYTNMKLEDFKKKYNINFNKKPPTSDLHPFTMQAISVMREWKLKPIIAEFIVYDTSFMIATGVDMLCLNQNGSLISIDWKCGMDGYISKSSGMMNGPLADYLSNSPLNQAYIQKTIESELMAISYDGIRPDVCYVVNLNKESNDPYMVPQDILKMGSTLYQYMLSVLNKEREDKKKEKINKIKERKAKRKQNCEQFKTKRVKN